MTATHAFLDHTSEVTLSLEASSLPDLLAEAGRALARLWLGSLPAPAGAPRRIEVHAADRATLLADWLNELIYRAEAERWVPVTFAVRTCDDRHVVADACGVPVAQAPSLVKAATYSGLDVRRDDGTWHATVTFDV